MTIVTGFLGLGLALVHLLIGKLTFLHAIPRSRWILLLHREDTTPVGLLRYFVAIGLDLVTTDFGLRQDAPASYDRVARWALSAAVLAGWLLGVLVDVAEPAIAMLFAFLAGGIVLNVLKEELPEERESRFGAFALGACGYALVLLVAG